MSSPSPSKKRKISSSTSKEVTPLPKIYANKLDKILDQGHEFVTSALKVVQRFERQKLARRIKDARSKKDEKNVTRIVGEIEALNKLDASVAAKRHMVKIFGKIKSIKEGNLPIEWKENESEEKWSVEQMNVTARLYSAQQVKDVIDVLVKAVKDEFEKQSRDVSGSMEIAQDELKDESEDENEENDMSTKPSHQPRLTSKSKHVLGSSNFLPSLTTAAYLSGSESEASDINEDLAPRKNRRGQRARQAINERKFGVTAKHLLKERDQKKESKDRGDGWDARKGAMGSKNEKPVRRDNTGRKELFTRIPSEQAKPKVILASNKAQEKKKQDQNVSLHPSWIARKEAKKKESVNVKPTGKKIVFD
jgi:hypothetical protein